MKKSEVYSWRITPERKNALEDEARREGTTVAALLDRITKEWIKSRRGGVDDQEEQARLHRNARKVIGILKGRDPHRAERARAAVRNRLTRQHGR